MTTATPRLSPYLQGNFAPVTDEVTVADLKVDGSLPAALDGLYARIGPNPLGEPPEPYHWFIGDGMVHGVRISGGRALWYRNRWVRTDDVARRLGEEPVGGPAQPLYDVSNTNVMGFAGRLLTFTEGCHPYELDGELGTRRRFDPGPLPHGLTAHPKIDPATGRLCGFSYWFSEPYLIYHEIDPDGGVVVTVPVEIPAPVSMHDFALTGRYAVFFDQPAAFDLSAAATSGFPFRWKPELGARVGLLDRSTGETAWYDTDVCYCFHPLNAYEAPDGTVVVDVPRQASVYADDDMILPPDSLRMERWTVDPAAGKVVTELIDDTPQEFCRVNPARIGSPHRYGYTIAMGGSLPYGETSVFKHDLVAGTRTGFDFGAGNHPGEMVFVADPDRADAEDGGWLMGLVHHDGAGTSLVVLDAADPAAGPVATVSVPRRVPYGFHGEWIPAGHLS